VSRSGYIDPRILELSISWKSVVSFTLRPLYSPGKSPRYPLYRRLGGPQSRSGRRGEEKILDPTGTRNFDPTVVQAVAIPTELSRLLAYVIVQNETVRIHSSAEEIKTNSMQLSPS
jgi:hypothetical protein